MDLGIDLSVATLKEYALSQGIEKSYSAMSQGEKMMLRYKYLMQQTSTQQGDFQRTALSTANALRVLKAYASEITTQIGSGLNAALRHVIVGLNKFMKYVLAAARAFATFMKTIFGDYKGGASGVNLDGALSDADDSADSLADSAESAAGGLGDADEAAKKLKKDLAVLPFDELNQLAKDQESTSSNAGTGTGGGDIGDLGDFGDLGDGLLGDAVDKIKGKLGELETFFDRWARLIKGYFNAKNWEGLGKALAWGINQGLDELYKLLDPKKAGDAINKFLDPFITTFNSFVDAIHWDTLGSVIGRGITILVNAFNRLLDPKTGINFNNIGKKLGVMLNNAIKDINWRGVGNLISNRFMVGWRVFHGFIKEFNAEDAGNALGAAIGGAIEKFDPILIGDALGTAVTKIATFMKNAFSKKETWVELGTKIAAGINAFLDDFDGQEVADGINAMLGAILTTIGSMLLSIDYADLMTAIGDFVSGLGWASIASTAVANLIDGFKEAVGDFFDNLKETFSWENTEAIFAEANNAFEQGGMGMIEGIGLGFLGAISFLLEPIQNVFDSIMQFFFDVFGITDVAENFLTIGEKVIGGLIKGADGETPSLLEVIQGLPSKIFEAAGDALEWLKQKGSDAIQGIRNGWDSVLDSSLLSEVRKLGSNVFSEIGDILSVVKEKGSDIIKGIRQGWDEVKDSDLFDMLGEFKDDVFDKIGDIFNTVTEKGSDIIDGISDGYDTAVSDFLDIVGDLPDNIYDAVGDLFDLGQEMIQDFAEGLNSMIDFPSPHIDWDWNGQTLTIGNWQWTLPTFSVDWYAKGGLFTRPTLAGFGEAGDEAALPLENQATMNRIARAIVDNSDGAFGLSEDQLASAVARGYVQAMMSNQGNERPMVINATLYTEDNEVLARAVQKGNQSIDFRNNATPQYS